MPTLQPRVYILDDDEIVRWSYQEILATIGASCVSFASAVEFFAAYQPHPCECLLIDLRMPDIGGLEVQRRLLSQRAALPMIFVSGYSEVSAAVEALRNGAFHFLEKPVPGTLLIEVVQNALARSRELHAARIDEATREARLSLLTAKERRIAEAVAAGRSSRQIADALKISVRTVENHRANIMQKLHADSLADLIRLFL